MRSLAIALLLALVVPATARAYRTAADSEGFEPGERVAWQSTIRWRVSGPVDGVSERELEQAVEDAFQVWHEVSCAAFTTERVEPGSSTEAADGIVTFRALGDDWDTREYAPAAGGRTELVYRDSTGAWAIADADVFLNDLYFDLALDPSGSQRDLRAILVHEIGHVLGLLHCCGPHEGADVCTDGSQCARSTMNPAYTPEYQRVVGSDDAAGLCWLYPIDACTGVTCSEGEICEAGSCRGAPRSCASDDACESYERCVRNECEAYDAPLGDPCTDDRECQYGDCGTSGTCVLECISSPCPTGYDCDGRHCIALLGELGEGCGDSLDCIGDRCLEGAEEAPVCTRPCGARGDPACPRTWTCETVDGRSVCAPPRSASCTASVGASAPVPLALILWIPLMYALRRDRR